MNVQATWQPESQGGDKKTRSQSGETEQTKDAAATASLHEKQEEGGQPCCRKTGSICLPLHTAALVRAGNFLSEIWTRERLWQETNLEILWEISQHQVGQKQHCQLLTCKVKDVLPILLFFSSLSPMTPAPDGCSKVTIWPSSPVDVSQGLQGAGPCTASVLYWDRSCTRWDLTVLWLSFPCGRKVEQKTRTFTCFLVGNWFLLSLLPYVSHHSYHPLSQQAVKELHKVDYYLHHRKRAKKIQLLFQYSRKVKVALNSLHLFFF